MPGPTCFISGTLSCLSAPELLGLANATLKTCTVELRLGEIRKKLWLRDGQLVHATSSDPLDRLGPTLLRQGRLTLEALARAESLVQSGRKLGRVLVDEGLLRAPDVYQGIAGQVRHIALSVFDAADGEFLLDEPGAEPPSEVKLPQRTRDLLLEAVKRPEMLAHADSVLPDLAAVPECVPGAQPGDAERTVFERIDGRRTAAAVIEAARVGPVHGRLSLATLAEAGLVRLHVQREPPAASEAPAARAAPSRDPFEAYRRALRHAFTVLRDRTRGGHHNLDLYLLDPRSAPGILDEVSFGDDGVLDVQRVLQNARATAPEPVARARALEALDKLLSYALFELKNLLPEQAARDVAAEVQRHQRGE